jgi:hypothetical protein
VRCNFKPRRCLCQTPAAQFELDCNKTALKANYGLIRLKEFEFDCNKTADGRTNVTFLGTMPLLNISLFHGEIRVKHRISSMCYNQSRRNISYTESGMTLDNPPFTFSEQRNKFTVVGFNIFAYMIGTTVSYLKQLSS